MDEHCVFCGTPIPDDAVYCQGCAPFVEKLDPGQRKALDTMLADKNTRETFRKNWELIKENIPVMVQAVMELVHKVADWLMELANHQEEGRA